MKKIALHIDESNKIVLLEYKDVDERKKSSFLYGEECHKYLKKLSKNKIVDIYENPNGKDVELEYDNYVIKLNDYSKLFRKKALAPILNNIRIYHENIELPKYRRKKVTRKNKYTKCKVIATGLAFFIMIGSALGLFHRSNKSYNDDAVVITESMVDELEEDFITTDISSEEEVVMITLKKDIKISKEKTIPTVLINYDDRSNTTKASTTKSYYSELINKYANIYGLDAKLVTAIATQERGVHSGIKDDGGATGLMQVQNSIWCGNKLSAYNFSNKSVESILVDEQSLSDVEYNIKVGCMIFQNNLKMMNYNTLAAIQCYNMGYGNMRKILTTYSLNCGKNIDQILNDVTDTEWMNYRDIIKVGDQRYIENVLSWIGDDIEFNNKKIDGNQVSFTIKSIEDIKTMH